MKKNYYIFLDIDGVLYDYKFLIPEMENGNIKKGGLIKNFNPKSIYALNFLIKYLEKKYNVNLVITSAWRYNLNLLKEVLLNNGLIFNKEILKIETTEENFRSKEIQLFIKKNKIKNNFVIIDDETQELEGCFNKKNIIKTNIFDDSLNLKHIKNYILQNNNEKVL